MRHADHRIRSAVGLTELDRAERLGAQQVDLVVIIRDGAGHAASVPRGRRMPPS